MLRLLLIDDNTLDRALIIYELRREFPHLMVEEVIDNSSFNKALNMGNFDIALTDYHLGWNDGLSVVRELKSRIPNCPVIMFTDRRREEIAVEAIKAGVDDYITKSARNYARLPVAVRATLKGATGSIRLLQQAIKEQEEIMNALQDIVYVLDSNGNLLKWNKRLETITGLDAKVLQGRSALDFFPEAEKATIARALQKVIEKGEAEVEGHLIGFDKVLLPYEWKGVTLKDEAGNVIGLTGTGRDITERKLAEKALQQLNANLERQVSERTAQLQQALEFEATLKRITDQVRDSLDESQILYIAMQELVLTLGVICCDTALYNLADGTSTIRYEYTAFSNDGINRWSYATPSSVGRTLQMADFPEGYHQLLQGQYFQFCEITPDAVRSQVAILACPIVNDQGVLGDLWLFNHLECAFNELEIRLVQQVANQCGIAIRTARLYQASLVQVQELEKLNSLKDDFLSTISHELRTPIANMKMALQMLKVSSTAQRQERYLEILQAECARESELINDLLDLQRLETASYPMLLREAVGLQDCLPSIIEPFRARMMQREQTLQLNLPSDLPTLLLDRASLERILAELLNNACKYTHTGGEIVLSICYKSIEAVTIFTISNSAEIPVVELPRIFDKFYRVPNTDPWKQGGTGLGLALVQKLVEQLQGSIFVESSEGWTTFTIQLPNLNS